MSTKSIQAAFPLSPQQTGMLYASLAEREKGLFIEQFTCRIRGNLNVALFREAWQKVVDKHEMLRTAFIWKSQKEPIQVVLSRAEIGFQRQDLRAFTAPERALRVEAFLGLDAQQPFNLSRPPLMRIALSQVEEMEYQFVWTIHHIVVDGWCRPLVLEEASKIYAALAAGESVEIKPSPPYRNYVAWLKKQDSAAAETFWREYLSGFIEPTALGRPVNEPLSPDRAAGLDFAENRLPEAVVRVFQNHVKKYGVTLNTVLQGAWALLLSRYSGKNDVVFGTTVSGRPPGLEGVDQMVGLFINTLPFRIQILPNSEFFSWLQQLQQQHAEIRNYEHCSAGQVHGWSGVPLKRPLYESIIVFQNYPGASSGFGLSDAVEITEIRSVGAKTAYPLTLLAGSPGKNGIAFRAIYNRARFANGSVAALLQHLMALLTSIAASPDSPVSALAEFILDGEVPIVFAASGPDPQHNEFVAPRNDIEREVASIWAEVLGVSEVSVTADFLDLGGHSLAATQLINALQARLQVYIPVRTLFECSTVARLASAVVQQIVANTESSSVSEVLNQIESGN
ncbi:MAG TPA: condensation domain-containing protein [Candidatus Angelobacter sp.]|nr:condensation domain-containing protein [Candidatus Angelobacter sp.]